MVPQWARTALRPVRLEPDPAAGPDQELSVLPGLPKAELRLVRLVVGSPGPLFCPFDDQVLEPIEAYIHSIKSLIHTL